MAIYLFVRCFYTYKDRYIDRAALWRFYITDHLLYKGKTQNILFLKSGIIYKTSNPKKNGEKYKHSTDDQRVDRKVLLRTNSKENNEKKSKENLNVSNQEPYNKDILKEKERQKSELILETEQELIRNSDLVSQLCSNLGRDKRKLLKPNNVRFYRTKYNLLSGKDPFSVTEKR